MEMIYFTKADSKTPHMVFIGRWCPLHTGHTWIIEKKLKEENKPVLILVRDTEFDEFSAWERADLVAKWMSHNNITGTVCIIPDIEGVYYGRGVGYNVDEIKPPKNIKTISATKIRELIKNNDESWTELVAPGTAEYIKELMK